MQTPNKGFVFLRFIKYAFLGNLVGGLMDKQSAVLASKEDLSRVESNMTTKQDLQDLKSYIQEGFESVMQGMDDLANSMSNKERIDLLVEWTKEISQKVGIKSRF